MTLSQVGSKRPAPARRRGAFYVKWYGSPLIVRLLLWLGFGGLAALIWVRVLRGADASLLWVASVMIGVIVLIELTWGRYRPLRKPLLTIDATGIGSTAFPRSQCHLPWQSIGSIAIRKRYGIAMLVVEPVEPTSWLRRRLGVLLGGLSKADRQQVETLVTHLRVLANSGVAKEVQAEKAFLARMNTMPRPWAVYSLIAANIGVWLLMVLRGAPWFSNTPVSMLVDWGGNVAVLAHDGQWWRMLTATFLHGGIVHVAMNMVVLFMLGRKVEWFLGPRNFLLVYFGAGLLGSAASLHFSAQAAVAVGASGAVFGVGGALLVIALRNHAHLPREIRQSLIGDSGFMICYSLIRGFSAENIDNAAHVGGLIGGLLLAACLPDSIAPQPAWTRAQTKTRSDVWSRFVPLAVCTAIVVVVAAMLSPPGTQDQRDSLAVTRQFEQAVTQFQAALKDVVADAAAMTEGTLSEEEWQTRSQTLRSVAFTEVYGMLASVVLPPDDKRVVAVKDMMQISDVMSRLMAMEYRWDIEAGGYMPRNPERLQALQEEVEALMERFTRNTKQLTSQR